MFNNTALVLEGGGFRGIFTAGVLEVLLENDMFFNAAYGVSAGASYGVSYLAKQAGRNIAVNQFIGDKRYCGVHNWMKKGSLFSWDFIFEEIPQNIIPFDYEALKQSETDFYVGTSNCITGESEYFLLNPLDKTDFKTVLSASCSLPLIAPVVQYKGLSLLDGGLSDSIPYHKALADGHQKVVVVLTQPQSYTKKPLKMSKVFKWHYRKYPKVYDLLYNRSHTYNKEIQQLEQLEKDGVAFVFRPKEILEVSRLENKPEKTEKVFWQAYEYAQTEMDNFKKWLAE